MLKNSIQHTHRNKIKMNLLKDYKSIIFIIFKTKDYANSYYKWSYYYRDDSSLWRVAKSNNIIVVTNDMNIHNIIFKLF